MSGTSFSRGLSAIAAATVFFATAATVNAADLLSAPSAVMIKAHVPAAAAVYEPTATDDSAAVAATVDRFHQALASGDSATALAMLAPDAVILESGGVETPAEYRAHHLPGDIAFARAVQRERGPIRVKVQGDVAWASSSSTVQGEYRGRQINSTGAELMVLTRVQGDWRIAAIHWSSRARTP
jgi:ketosteroid isomerase-like protein